MSANGLRQVGRVRGSVWLGAGLCAGLLALVLAGCERENWCEAGQRACERQCQDGTPIGTNARSDCLDRCRLENPCRRPPPSHPPRPAGRVNPPAAPGPVR